MFGIGGGLHILHDMKDGKPEWKTALWEGDPQFGHEVGRIYVMGQDHKRYLQIADSSLGGWVWQKLEKEEELSWKTGREDWEYKLYFENFKQKPWMLISLNNELNKKGWGTASVLDNENISFPDDLELVRLETDYMGDTARERYLVTDPERAEVKIVKSRDLTEEKENELENVGWTFVDSNIARVIFARTTPHESAQV